MKPTIFGLVTIVAIGGLAAVFWGSSPSADALAKRAGNAFMERRYDEAAADLARVNRLRSPTALDSMLLGQLAMVGGRTDEAVEALAKVPDDYPLAAQARLQAGQLELRRSRYVPAERLLLDSVRLDPKAVQARRELIYLYGMQLRRPELGAMFRDLSKLTPLNYSEVFLWCLTRGVTWDAREVVETQTKCLEADPDDRWARLGLAEALRESSRLDEAERALTPLPESDPKARAARARIALERGDDQGAEAILAAGPADDLDLSLLRGRFALARGDGPEAVRQFRVAHAQSPNLREAVIGLGQALKLSGDEAAAAPLLEEARNHERLGTLVQKAAVEANRDDPALVRDLAAACASIGRYPEARAWYNLAITRDPFDIAAQDGMARLKQLEAQAAPPAG